MPRPTESVYLFAAWSVQPGGVGRGQDGDTRQLAFWFPLRQAFSKWPHYVCGVNSRNVRHTHTSRGRMEMQKGAAKQEQAAWGGRRSLGTELGDLRAGPAPSSGMTLGTSFHCSRPQ